MCQARGRLYGAAGSFKSPAPETRFSVSGFLVARMEVPMVTECGAPGFEAVLPEQPAFKCLPLLNVNIARDSRTFVVIPFSIPPSLSVTSRTIVWTFVE